jgi:neutral trehalase
MVSGYITLDKLKEIVKVCESKNENGFKFTASISDQSNQYGQNVSFFAEQSKEQRDAKVNKYYFGNGKVFWTDNKISLGTKEQTIPTAEVKFQSGKIEDVRTLQAGADDLPF